MPTQGRTLSTGPKGASSNILHLREGSRPGQERGCRHYRVYIANQALQAAQTNCLSSVATIGRSFDLMHEPTCTKMARYSLFWQRIITSERALYGQVILACGIKNKRLLQLARGQANVSNGRDNKLLRVLQVIIIVLYSVSLGFRVIILLR